MRVGLGYDAHRLVEGRRLVLGGVEIPHAKGLAGHSDADVLIHAVCDALLGAAGLGDIGTQFPDTEEQYRGADSMKLLGRAAEMLKAAGFSVRNVDAVVIAEQPRLAPFAPAMKERIGAVLGIGAGSVGIKATTTEAMGFEGRGEGIAAMAVALIAEQG
jgi:2-C-methyl-D-erythritol 2,4-cyclodiphosphate synthase